MVLKYFLIFLSGFLLFFTFDITETKQVSKSPRHTSLNFRNISNSLVRFLLHRNNSKTVKLTKKNAHKFLEKRSKFIFIIHDWVEKKEQSWIKKMTGAFHDIKIFNTISVDWSILAKKDLFLVSEVTRSVGLILWEFILALNLVLNEVHLIGDGFGGVVSAIVGRKHNGKIGRITGLDTTILPEFFDPENLRLSPGDAKFVDVIHTSFPKNSGIPCGNVEFFVNYNYTQPDCLHFDNPANCNHKMGREYFTQTILDGRKFPGFKKNGSENVQIEPAYMGYWVNPKLTGFYYVKTPKIGNNVLKHWP